MLFLDLNRFSVFHERRVKRLGQVFYYAPSILFMTSSCIRLEFLDRKRDGIAYRTFYGHGVPHASLGEPGALFVDESKHVLYGRTDTGWTKFPGTAADKTKSVKHPVLADTILWCTPNQYGWTKASDCTNRGSYRAFPSNLHPH